MTERVLKVVVILMTVCIAYGHEEHHAPGYDQPHTGSDAHDAKPHHYADGHQRPYPPIHDYGYEEEGCFRYPAACKPGYDCDFEASWESFALSDEVYFKISARLPKGYWAGVGFSDDKSMINSDCITGLIDQNDNLVLKDRYLQGKSPSSVPVDRYQDASPISYYHHNGVMEIQFKRLKKAYGRYDKSLEGCVYFLFAWGGQGTYGGGITKHTKHFVSKDFICLGSIHGDIGYSASSSSSHPQYEFLKRPMPHHYDPCQRKLVCRKNEFCVRQGYRAVCKCPYTHQNKKGGCIRGEYQGIQLY